MSKRRTAGTARPKDSDDYCTPAEIAACFRGVDLDPCSNPHSHVRARLSVALPDDGLDVEWSGSVYVNCPYSAPLGWCRKAVDAAHAGADVALLLKLDTTTRWWAALMASRLQRVFPFRRRIPFERPGLDRVTANFPSVLVLLQRTPTSPFDPAVAALKRDGWLW